LLFRLPFYLLLFLSLRVCPGYTAVFNPFQGHPLKAKINFSSICLAVAGIYPEQGRRTATKS